VDAGFTDAAYTEAGAKVSTDAAEVYGSDMVVKVAPPQVGGAVDEVSRLKRGAGFIGFMLPLTSPELVKGMAEGGVTSFSMELVPRITVAQRMDALSSQATSSGYIAALEGALAVDSFFPMLTTAAGTIPPGNVLVIGAGVAGLQAIATAKRLGARVKGFDIRPAAAEQVESLGAKFVGITLDEAETKGGYAKEVTEEQQKKEHELLGERRGHHHRAGAGAEGAGAHHPGHGGGHAAGVGDRGPGGGVRRELRADGGRRDRRPQRREGHREGQRPERPAAQLQHDVLQEHPRAAQAPVRRRNEVAEGGFRR
jgi:hypothetical protein